MEKAYAWGRSQTGRCIRDMIHQGFNADIEGKRVFDGVLPHVSGGGLMWLNHRFACGVSAAGQQYEDHENIADRFPFSYAESTDHITGKRDAILNARRAIRSCCIHRQVPSTGNATVHSYIRTRKATILISQTPFGSSYGRVRSTSRIRTK